MYEDSKEEFGEKIIGRPIRFLIKIYNKLLEQFIFFKWYNYYKSRHLEVKLKKGFWPVFHWYTHQEYLAQKIQLLAENFKKLSLKDFISLVIDECDHCNVITFRTEDKKKKLLFWVGDGEYVNEWLVEEEDKSLSKSTYQMLGVLNELEIHSNRNAVPKRLPYYEEISLLEEAKSYKVYFRKYNDDAKKFIFIMIKDIFKIKKSNLVIELR
jgi:hypothetical protein